MGSGSSLGRSPGETSPIPHRGRTVRGRCEGLPRPVRAGWIGGGPRRLPLCRGGRSGAPLSYRTSPWLEPAPNSPFGWWNPSGDGQRATRLERGRVIGGNEGFGAPSESSMGNWRARAITVRMRVALGQGSPGQPGGTDLRRAPADREAGSRMEEALPPVCGPP
jgi:hypothetical protein